jgi:hypothetical protein
MNIGDVAVFKLGIGVKSGIVEKINDQTVHVRIKEGSVIKRHIQKHIISSYNMPSKEGYASDQVDKNTQFSDIGQS